MKLNKQISLYLVIAGIQYIIDVVIFALLILFTAPEIANILSRLIAALFGYGLNGVFTFKAANQSHIHLNSLIRFIFVWCIMTILSTLLIDQAVKAYCNGGWYCTVGAKLVVEILLATLSFTLQKFLVYRS